MIIAGVCRRRLQHSTAAGQYRSVPLGRHDLFITLTALQEDVETDDMAV